MQCYISESLEGLDFKTRYGLTDFRSNKEPLVIFGMYRDEDFELFRGQRGEVIQVWQGSDAKNLNPDWVNILKDKGAKHYSISHWIKERLDSHGIKNELKPISATFANLKPVGKGNAIYFYSSDQSYASENHYGEFMLKDIKRKTGLSIIRGSYGVYPKSHMPEIYKQCFINLRLTDFDGCPNGNLEMGMMGIPSIFNGDIPGSIKWNNVDDICESIWAEFIKKDEPTDLHEQIYKFLNIQFP